MERRAATVRFVAGGITALLGAVAACSTYETEPDAIPPTPTPGVPEAGALDAAGAPKGCDAITSLDADPKNCGRCARDCLGGVCAAGVCAPVDLGTATEPLQYLRLEGGDLFATTSTGLVRGAKAGGAIASVAKDLKDVRDLAIDGEHVFCVSLSGIEMFGRTNKTERVHISNDSATAISVKGDAVLVCEGNYGVVAQYKPVSASVPTTTFKSAKGCQALELAGTEFFVGGPTMYRGALINTKVGSAFGTVPARRFALDDAWVYSIAAGSDAISRTARAAGGPSSTLAISPQAVDDGDIAVDATHVYWTTGRANGNVYRVLKAGGDAEKIAGPVPFPKGIAVDDEAVYWTERDSFKLRKRAK